MAIADYTDVEARQTRKTAVSDDPVIAAAGLSAEGARISRQYDLVIVVIAFFVLTAAYHIHFMLLAGDWDFWIDWKDRQFWPTLTPVVAIMFPAAAQYFLWTKFRLPFGATLCVLGLIIAEWVVRILGFHGWAGFPFSLIFPATMIPGALVLDSVLLLTRSWLLTGIFGAWAFGLLFYPSNWPMIAGFHIPVESEGQVASVADMVGYTFVRSATPEYLRFIERGTLRTFGGHSAYLSAVFSAFLCMLVYYVWWFIGMAFSMTPWAESPVAKFLGVKPKEASVD